MHSRVQLVESSTSSLLKVMKSFVYFCLIAQYVAVMSMETVVVENAGSSGVNGLYEERDPSEIPEGFAFACKNMNWDSVVMWDQLTNKKSPWFEKEDGSYIYFNRGDGKWWIDNSEGGGVYIAQAETGTPRFPEQKGYKLLPGAMKPAPNVHLVPKA